MIIYDIKLSSLMGRKRRNIFEKLPISATREAVKTVD